MKGLLLKRLSAVLCYCCWLVLALACDRTPIPRTYFPETGVNALYQRSLDLRSNLNVLSIAIEPGYEDLAALAYLRLSRGASVLSAYVTNGEAGESDVRAEYPPYLAAMRREEAGKALAYLGGGVYFLHMPGIAAASDSAKIQNTWRSDTLQARLTRLLAQFTPDIVILARDCLAAQSSLLSDALRSEVLTAVITVASGGSQSRSSQLWQVKRVFVEAQEALPGLPALGRSPGPEGQGSGVFIPKRDRHPRWQRRYDEIAEEAARAYVSLATQRQQWRRGKESSYLLVYPKPWPAVHELDAGLPEQSTPRLRRLERTIHEFSAFTEEGNTTGALSRLAAVMDSVDYHLARHYDLRPHERKTLLHWKRGLEELRCALLGVEVKYAISDSALAGRQLTYLTIKAVHGIRSGGKTDVFFASGDDGWVVDERLEKRVALKIGEPYTLLSPAQVDYNFPPGLYGLTASNFGKPLLFFVIHRASSPHLSFVHRTIQRISFAPRFVSEILTPIVRMVPGERIVVRLENFSRDGVADTIKVEDALASSTESVFRLSRKGASHLDTLFLSWKGNPEDGSYLIPVEIDGIPVARFAARKFQVAIDASKKIGIITAVADSPTAEALRRMDAKYVAIQPSPDGASFRRQIDSLDVLIVDRRALTLRPGTAAFKKDIDAFVNRGGHLVVLAQDAAVWNTQPLWDDMTLLPSRRFDEETPVQMAPGHALLASPNAMAPGDWDEWLFLRAYNVVSGKALAGASVAVRAQPEGQPLLLTMAKGRGRQTYVDLALGPQLMNIHAGAFRLLANIVSF